MIKQHIYLNILVRQSGIDYISVVHFEKSLINMDKVKSPTKNNQL